MTFLRDDEDDYAGSPPQQRYRDKSEPVRRNGRLYDPVLDREAIEDAESAPGPHPQYRYRDVV